MIVFAQIKQVPAITCTQVSKFSYEAISKSPTFERLNFGYLKSHKLLDVHVSLINYQNLF